MVFLDRARVEVCFAGCRGVLTLEKGSRFVAALPQPRVLSVDGGELTGGDRTCVRIKDPVAAIGLNKAPFTTVPLSLRVRVPSTARTGDRFVVDVSQQNQGRTVGGAVAVLVVT
jgi:hypothetical protein